MWRDQRLLILCYHGLGTGDESEWNGDLFLRASTFTERMESLRRHNCNVLSLDKAIDALFRSSLPKRAVVITFDDGFANFHSHALPILRKYNFPATVYLSSYYAEHHDLPVFPVACSYLLWKARGQMRSGLNLRGLPETLDLRSAETREAAARQIISSAENELTGSQKDELLLRLAELLGQDFEALRTQRTCSLMNPEELSEASRSGVSIEMHSRSHRILNDRRDFKRDLQRNADRIKDWTGVAPSHFCYPSGLVAPHWVEWLREFPVKSAVTCTPAFCSADNDALLLPRYVDGSRSSSIEFESWITGFAPLVARKAAMRMPVEAEAPAVEGERIPLAFRRESTPPSV